jgi:hypothetical protein
LKQHRKSDAPFLKPAEAVAAMEIPEGFEVSIFAAEPDIGEPIAFTFDDRGRVWVVENYNYVNRRNHKQDEILSRIQIFEDTDSDGVFDTKKLFTDQIKFSSGIGVGFGGVYLGSPPELLFIPDADRDDVPDGKPEVLLDGWGFQDRHETLIEVGTPITQCPPRRSRRAELPHRAPHRTRSQSFVSIRFIVD